MNDIMVRLRDPSLLEDWALRQEAANDIEQLGREILRLRCELAVAASVGLATENEGLRALLKRWIDFSGSEMQGTMLMADTRAALEPPTH